MRDRQPVILAIANQKGGVGKTTTAVNLAAALAEKGRKVLVVDLDPQGNASTGFGVELAEREKTTYDLLLDTASFGDIVRDSGVPNVHLSPASEELSSADIDLGARESRSSLLREALARPAVQEAAFDYILIDCPPSLSLLTVNAMVAAHALLVPLQSEFFALEGLSQLMLTVREVRQSANPGLRINGIVLTMYDGRNRLSRQVADDARTYLGEMVFETVIPRNVRLSEAPSYAVPVLDYAGTSKGAKAYRELAREVMHRHESVTA